jgi:hypothetical protein
MPGGTAFVLNRKGGKSLGDRGAGVKAFSSKRGNIMENFLKGLVFIVELVPKLG